MKNYKKKSLKKSLNSRRVSAFFVFLFVLGTGYVGLPVDAAGGFSFEGFRLSTTATYVAGGQQEGAGDFNNGNAANAGQYAEGMCVPVYIEATNTSGDFEDYDTEIEFDHYRSQTGVIGYMGLETVTTSLVDVGTADDLNDFVVTGDDLTTLTSATTGNGVVVSVLVEGPFTGNDQPLTNTDSEGFYRITATGIPDQDTLQIAFCGRLSDQAGQYGQGSNLHIGATQGGGQIPSSPEDFLELPELTVIKHVVNDDGTIVPALTATDFTLDVDNNGTVTPVTGSEAPGVVVTLLPGTYAVTEADSQGYEASLVDCSGSLALANPAQTATCTVTNDDPVGPDPVSASLTLTKVVVGGTAQADEWSFAVNPEIDGVGTFDIPDGQSSVTIDNIPVDGSYEIVEVGPADYVFTSGTGDNCVFNADIATATVAAGNPATDASCTFTNTFVDTTATINVIKVLVNAPQGVEQRDFTFDIIRDGNSSPDNHFLNDPNFVDVEDVPEGVVYSIVESPVPADYDVTYSPDCSGTTVGGVDVTCTVTNTYNPAQPTTGNLTITKVINGTNVPADATPDDFSFLGVVDGDSLAVTPFEADGEVVIPNVAIGSAFSIFESGVSMDWDVTLTGCTGTMDADGQNCVITNTYNRETGSITINKVLPNDDGGTETVDNFDFYVDASVVELGVPLMNLLADSYRVDEVWNDNHDTQFPTSTATDVSEWYDITVECVATNSNTGLVTVLPVDELDETFDLTPADDIVCTITNDDIDVVVPDPTGHLTVTKIVVNDDDGDAEVSDFPLFVDNTSVVSGASNEFDVGTYTVSETNSNGYTATFSGDCNENGSVTITEDSDLECIITNDDDDVVVEEDSTLTLHLVIINDDGGSFTDNQFKLFADETEFEKDATVVVDPDTYQISEQYDVDGFVMAAVQDGYTTSFSGDCDSSGLVTVNAGSDRDCTVVVNDLAANDQDDPDDEENTNGGGGADPNRPRDDQDVPEETVPEPEVLGETDEVPVEEIPTPPAPQVLGETDELPRTGLPIGILALIPILAVVSLTICVRMDRQNSRGL